MGLDPVSMGVSAAATLAGGVIKRNEAHKASFVDEENGRQAILAGEFDALQTRKGERQIAGDLIAGMGASGTLFEGSNLDIIEQSAFQRESEIWALRARSKAESDNYNAEARSKRRAGNAALIGAGFGALTQALGGFAEMDARGRLSGQQSRERASILGGSTKLAQRQSRHRGKSSAAALPGFNPATSIRGI